MLDPINAAPVQISLTANSIEALISADTETEESDEDEGKCTQQYSEALIRMSLCSTRTQ
jgi:hypothetical protein